MLIDFDHADPDFHNADEEDRIVKQNTEVTVVWKVTSWLVNLPHEKEGCNEAFITGNQR